MSSGIVCYRCHKEYAAGRCGCKDGITLIHGDCRDVLPMLEKESVDLVLTDPPYGIPKGSCFWRNGGTSLEDWGEEIQNRQVLDWLQRCPVKDGSTLLEFMRAHPEAIEETCARHRQADWTPWHVVLIVKVNPPPTPRPTFVSGYEAALISYRGKRQWFGNGYVPNRWIGQTPNAQRIGVHPTQKPLDPIVLWASALSPEGGTILDPFAGSGTTGRAAKDLGRRCILIEPEEQYCEIAAHRLEQEVLFT